LRVAVASIEVEIGSGEFVAQRPREDAGWAVLCSPDAWSHELMVHVLEPYRRRGIGTQLVRALLHRAESRPSVFRGTERASLFWESLGGVKYEGPSKTVRLSLEREERVAAERVAADFLELVRRVHGGTLPIATQVFPFCERAKRVNVPCPVHAEACPLRSSES
jgi:GNAT superfamily N-acetyltransferase